MGRRADIVTNTRVDLNYGQMRFPCQLEDHDFRVHRELLGVPLEEEGADLSWFAVHGREYCTPSRVVCAQRPNLQQFVADLKPVGKLKL